MKRNIIRAAVAIAALTTLLVAAAPAPAAGLSAPATIKVARRVGNDPQGRIYRVDTVDFRTYCVRVLSHEWAPATAFSPEALKAGALAVKSYGWYWATRPTKLLDVRAWGADVDDTVNYQAYMDSDYGQKYWDAVDAVAGQVLTSDGAVLQASYRSGTYDASASGWYMSQWGTQYWADKGKAYDWMCRFYYRNVDIAPVAGVTAVGDASVVGAQDAGLDPLAADPSLKGPARLELIGPVLATPAHPALGQRVTLTFTLHNAGAEAGDWSALTLVGRGPQDEVRDFGTVTGLRLAAGEYRLFEARRVVDLPGVWRGWMMATRGDEPGLVGDGAPFELRVRRTASADGDTGAASVSGEGSPFVARHPAREISKKLGGPPPADALADALAGTFSL